MFENTPHLQCMGMVFTIHIKDQALCSVSDMTTDHHSVQIFIAFVV